MNRFGLGRLDAFGLGTTTVGQLPPVVVQRPLHGRSMMWKRQQLEQMLVRDEEDVIEFVMHVVLSGVLDE